jgi:hypothetical protein
LLGAFCAPGHHGYQRACDLISGQASMGHLGTLGLGLLKMRHLCEVP